MSVHFGNPKAATWHEHLQQEVKKLSHQTLKEKDLIKAAVTEGFVNALTELDLVENGRNALDKKPSYPGDAYYVRLSHKRICSITLIDLCERLTVCNLSNNFLQNLKPLRWCSNLFCLDVHSNQINHLPDKPFWSSLIKLTVLHLHDNGIFKLEELKHPSYSPSLCSITLYDTPISLKKNYRHCVVNAIWTLKALDGCVVSDEEIIEDANFSKQFKPMQPQFFFQSAYLKYKQDSSTTYRSVTALISKDLSVINKIQARWCPVLVIQRCIRGFLVRLKYNYVVDTRLWAAVSIQRFYRNFKGFPHPPPSSPIMWRQDILFQSSSSIKLDYETYLKLKRSRHMSTFSCAKSGKSSKSQSPHPWSKKSPDFGGGFNKRLHINIDLEKLEGKTTKMLQQEENLPNVSRRQIPMKKDKFNETKLIDDSRASYSAPSSREVPSDVTQLAQDLGLNTFVNGRKFKAVSKIGKYYTQHEFLGEVVRPTNETNDNDINAFRLSIRKPYMCKYDPLEELILRTVEGADDIRKSIREIEDRIKSAPPPKKVSHKVSMNADQKLFLKTHGSMNLSPFRAIDKAYKDRDDAERLLHRMHHVRNIKHTEIACKDKVRRYKRKYRNEATVRKHSDRIRILDALSVQRQISNNELEAIASKHNYERETRARAKKDYKFAQEFSCQNASIGKALVNHDRVIQKDNIKESKVYYVDQIKADLDQKKKQVNEYLKEVKLMRQANTSSMKNKLEKVLGRRANQRREDLMRTLREHEEKHERKLMTPTVLRAKEINPINEV